MRQLNFGDFWQYIFASHPFGRAAVMVGSASIQLNFCAPAVSLMRGSGIVGPCLRVRRTMLSAPLRLRTNLSFGRCCITVCQSRQRPNQLRATYCAGQRFQSTLRGGGAPEILDLWRMRRGAER